MDNKCISKTKAGKSCKATKQKGSDYCFFHDPEKKAQREKARAAGGRATSNLSKPAQEKAFIEKAIDKIETLKGEVVPDAERVNIKRHEDLLETLNAEVNDIKDNKAYSKSSIAERFLILKHYSLMDRILDKLLDAWMRELENKLDEVLKNGHIR